MSTVDPRRAGDVLPLWCTCRPPGHVRGISRCTDRDVEFELGRDAVDNAVMVVVEDEVPAPRFGVIAQMQAAMRTLGLPDGMSIDEVSVHRGGLDPALEDTYGWQATCEKCDGPAGEWRGRHSHSWGFVVAEAREHAQLHES